MEPAASTGPRSPSLAVGIGGAAAAPNVWVAAVLLVLAGVGNGAALVCNAVLIQQACRIACEAVRSRWP